MAVEQHIEEVEQFPWIRFVAVATAAKHGHGGSVLAAYVPILCRHGDAVGQVFLCEGFQHKMEGFPFPSR